MPKISLLSTPCGFRYVQVDHLIIHRYGIIIIESKSVSSKVKYNEHEEWNRLWNNHWDKMENPVKQAERQAKAIKEILVAKANQLRGKLLGLMQCGFKNMATDCLVALSDQCIDIKRPDNDPYLHNVFKADLITDKIDKLIAGYKERDRIFSRGEPPWSINTEEMTKVKDFLIAKHTPMVYEQNEPKPEEKATADIPRTAVTTRIESQLQATPVSRTKEEKIQALTCCLECGGKVTILWGDKYKNYYWHCTACGKNFPINYRCPTCQEKLRIEKSKKEFYIYCEPCSLKALYHRDE